MNDQNRIRLFDEWAKKYDYSVQFAREFPFDGYEQILDRIVALANPYQKMKILDLGIGTGNLAKRFVNYESLIWGLDYSNEMLAKAGKKLSQARFARTNFLGEWPAEFQRKYDRIVSAYVFHEFDFSAKMNLLRRLAENYLEDDGYIIVGDIAFPTSEIREKAKKSVGDKWDEDEYYWAADETMRTCDDRGLHAEYEQVSSCGGIFVITSK